MSNGNLSKKADSLEKSVDKATIQILEIEQQNCSDSHHVIGESVNAQIWNAVDPNPARLGRVCALLVDRNNIFRLLAPVRIRTRFAPKVTEDDWLRNTVNHGHAAGISHVGLCVSLHLYYGGRGAFPLGFENFCYWYIHTTLKQKNALREMFFLSAKKVAFE